jgi:multiple sugar transport system permease protein
MSEHGNTRSARGTPQPWLRSVITAVVTAFLLSPILVVFWLALRPPVAWQQVGPTLGTFWYVLTDTKVLHWLTNSLLVSLVSTVASVIVAAPAGYVLSRGRGRVTSAFSLFIFVLQSLPAVAFVIPLFIMFANLGLADTLTGVSIIYVASSIAVGCWMMTAYFDTVPVTLEEAAWIDGASIFRGFVGIILPNSLPGLLSTALFAFLTSWNDYLVASVFLRSDSAFTMPIGLQTFFQQNLADWGPVMACAVIMLAPPVIVFAVLNRYFSIGGIGGSLAGR